jgi:beta-glucosidase
MAAWFPGTEAGNGLADLLTGKISPSAKTPVSWPRSVGQIPLFYGERKGGRPYNPGDHYTSHYLDVPNTPLFGFGDGLSYGDFAYSKIRLSTVVLTESETLEVTVTLRSKGAHAAEETVFLFVADPVACVTRPLLELKGFQKIALEAGAEGQVNFTLPGTAFRFPGPDLKPLFEAGDMEILAGPSADRARLLSARLLLRV